MTLRFELDDLTRPAVHQLLEEHLVDMYATSPADSVHALDLDGLRAPGIEFWSAWEGEEPIATGALKRLSERDVELKSMRTSAHARGAGVGSAMVAHLIGRARSAGYAAIWLETGTEDFFGPAQRLYARHGFVECAPFGDYVLDPHSMFMTLSL
ncbi:GNAT family N-acetyltransferase [Nocardioides sp. BP30]|uniref:GNAT family N-acetyltransferase n=1 Tax=Nocardioides sp. BP30 TaxID=3036374 RepID=UPI002468317F|nr:GNAT family N-acetyltransferase [Nocardioides sp. BP30]WGL52644.1 GNAT family N-acetyltransferase [Nocardioides sp. BP30]